ncbi:MAG: diguanylate cyclase [Aphanothece sp. CMT-3BRIN-NPC111]|jgi:diguanylate cyclase (GGDEF)-like protein|nr:diguanylate cyclase [Aphanothece sp. CMT-3BRIN-NPC111]
MPPETLSTEQLNEIEQLRQEVEDLKAEKADMEVLLETTLAHADIIESELHELNQRLKLEIIERQQAQASLEASKAELQLLLKIIKEEKTDLEIILETAVEHADFIEALLHTETIRDQQTGLFNRRYLEQSLTREIKRANNNQQFLGIIMLDIDHFKQFNDNFGHEAGDLVLLKISQFIQKNIRSLDIVCRYGGEELTLIMPEASLEVTTARAEQLRQGVKQLQLDYGGQFLGQIAISLGVACFPDHGKTGTEVMQAADAALYLAKTQGRDRVCSAASLPLGTPNLTCERDVPEQLLQIFQGESTVALQSEPTVQKNMSVLFADIRDFSKLSSTMTPKDNFKFINGLFKRIEPTLIDNKGLLARYIGNAITALFSTSADDAVKAAIALLHQIAEYNLTRQRPERLPLSIDIAINTSSIILEAMGGYKQIEKTAISDAINLAAQIQKLNKYYQTPLLISQYTFFSLENPNKYATRLIDQVKISEKKEVVTVYEIFDADAPEIKQAKLATATEFEKGLLLYKIGNFSEAAKLFQYCLSQAPVDKAAQIYLSCCQQGINTTCPSYCE